MGDPLGDALATRVLRVGRALQLRGVDVALSEIIDAEQAAAAVDVGSRDQLRMALRSTLIKHPRHEATFQAVFDRLFPARPPGGRSGDQSERPLDPVEALVDGGDLGGLAVELVVAHAGIDGDLRSERHHLQRVWRGADLARLMSEARKLDPSLSTAELRSRIDELKRLMAAEIRAHLGEPDLSADRSDGENVETDVADIDFLNASRAEVEAMRNAVRPIARRIAGRLARRRRHQRAGRVNIRRTVRWSLANGGVPIHVAHNHRPKQRPELYVLCDVSGSVAEFSVFTLTLMAALSAEVDRTRSFIFADSVDEVTALLDRTEHGIEPWQLMQNTNVVRRDGHSDYGEVFQQFWDEVGRRDLRPTATIIITGDARSNHRAPNEEVLALMARRARRLYWLNPEPESEWDTHDSVMAAYAVHCSNVFEVRTLRQLEAAVSDVL